MENQENNLAVKLPITTSSFFWEKVCAALVAFLISVLSGVATYYAKSTNDSILQISQRLDKDEGKLNEVHETVSNRTYILDNHEKRIGYLEKKVYDGGMIPPEVLENNNNQDIMPTINNLVFRIKRDEGRISLVENRVDALDGSIFDKKYKKNSGLHVIIPDAIPLPLNPKPHETPSAAILGQTSKNELR